MVRHEALLYASADELVHGVRRFVGDGVARGEPVLCALPAGTRTLLEPLLPAGVIVTAMEDMGSNPARLIPLLRAWAADQGGRPVRVVGEGCWPGRPDHELAEQVRHEALVDLAFEDVPLSALCPYDLRRVGPAVCRDVERTHGHVCRGGTTEPSSRCGEALETADLALQAVPVDALELPVADGLRHVRAAVRELAMRAGLGRDRTDEALVAVSEAATNALVHGHDEGVVRLWVADGALACEVVGGGRIADPLIGRRPSHADSEQAHGLWLVNHLCDLVQLRSGDDGTVVRLHIRRFRTNPRAASSA